MRSRFQVACLVAGIVILCGMTALMRVREDKNPAPAAGSHLPLPEGEAPVGAFRFVALGDMGTGDEVQMAIARQMAFFQLSRPYDAVIMLGDNIYPDGNPADIPRKFELPYAALLNRGVKFYAALGNHDVKRGREAQIKYSKFNMGGHPYYSFTKGDDLVEFFALDTTNYDPAQALWLEKQLSRSKALWRIVYFHHPIYSSAEAHGSDLRLRARLEPLLVEYGVAAVFSGHDHTYERVKPQKGVQYFVSGAGGKLRRGDLDRRSPLFAAGADDRSSFMFIELDKELLRFWAVDAEGQILDSGSVAPRLVAKRAAAGQ